MFVCCCALVCIVHVLPCSCSGCALYCHHAAAAAAAAARRIGQHMLTQQAQQQCVGGAVAMLSEARVWLQCQWLLLDSHGLAASDGFVVCASDVSVLSQHNPVLCV